jgi:hypothetical protein
MRKAIYLNVLTHVEGAKDTLPDAQLALREVEKLVHEAAGKAGTAHIPLMDVKRVRVEEGPDHTGVHVGSLIYLEDDQDAAANFTKLATDKLTKLLNDVYKQSMPANLKLTIHNIEENTNAVDELADEAGNAKSANTGNS